MKRIAVTLFLLLAGAAQAGSPLGYARQVRITRVDTLGNGLVTIAVDAIDDLAACATLDPVNQVAWVVDTNTDGGQALYANVLFAASSGALVSLYGAGNCLTLNVPNPPMGPLAGMVEVLGRISSPAAN